VGRGRKEDKMVKEGEYSENTVEHIYVNGKMIPVETIPGMRGGKGKEEW
jgi:hypothetical protein